MSSRCQRSRKPPSGGGCRDESDRFSEQPVDDDVGAVAATSQRLQEWFTQNKQLAALKESCEFQVYTATNAIYKTRYADIVPAEQFPVVLFQDATGGHIHAAGRSMIPSTSDELYSDLRHGYPKLLVSGTWSDELTVYDERLTSLDETFSSHLVLTRFLIRLGVNARRFKLRINVDDDATLQLARS